MWTKGSKPYFRQQQHHAFFCRHLQANNFQHILITSLEANKFLTDCLKDKMNGPPSRKGAGFLPVTTPYFHLTSSSLKRTDVSDSAWPKILLLSFFVFFYSWFIFVSHSLVVTAERKTTNHFLHETTANYSCAQCRSPSNENQQRPGGTIVSYRLLGTGIKSWLNLNNNFILMAKHLFSQQGASWICGLARAAAAQGSACQA